VTRSPRCSEQGEGAGISATLSARTTEKMGHPETLKRNEGSATCEDQGGDVEVAPSFEARSGLDAARGSSVDVCERTTRGRKLRLAHHIGPGKIARHAVALLERGEGQIAKPDAESAIVCDDRSGGTRETDIHL
jgi:hypothetical protein